MGLEYLQIKEFNGQGVVSRDIVLVRNIVSIKQDDKAIYIRTVDGQVYSVGQARNPEGFRLLVIQISIIFGGMG